MREKITILVCAFLLLALLNWLHNRRHKSLEQETRDVRTILWMSQREIEQVEDLMRFLDEHPELIVGVRIVEEQEGEAVITRVFIGKEVRTFLVPEIAKAVASTIELLTRSTRN